MPVRIRAFMSDRTSVALAIAFVVAAAFYAWTVSSSYPPKLTDNHEAYNALAEAFTHFRLYIGNAPAALTRLPNPYSPQENAPFQGYLHDIVLYGGRLYITWGPAPALVVLVPLKLIGLEPNASAMTLFFSIVGLGFTFATLRLVIRRLGDVPLWMCVLAAFTLALATALPFTLRRPATYEEEIASGYCFGMAAIWLAIAMLANPRRRSLARLALTSLCFGLAMGSRVTLAFSAVLLVPVYLGLRARQPRRGLVMALAAPLGLCVLMLLVYNQLRFGNILENGTRYQLAGLDQRTARFYDLAYLPPGLWVYLLSPPRVSSLFPFLFLSDPPVIYPGTLPGLYRMQSESVGLLPMAPILVFLAVLPWLWRRSTRLGRLAVPLLLIAGASMACLLFLSYVFYSATERYAVDFATPLVLAAIAGWLVLSTSESGWRRRLARFGGGGLAIWSCFTGLAVSFTGYENLLASTHPATWHTLQSVTAPVSTGLAKLAGHPALGEVREVTQPGTPYLEPGERAQLVVVSPDARSALLLATWTPAEEVNEHAEGARYTASVAVEYDARARSVYRVGPGRVTTRIRLQLSTGLNRVTFAMLDTVGGPTPEAKQVLLVSGLALAKEP